MSIGVIGKKEGMTRLFSDEGVSVPVTVVSVFPNSITQVKSEEIDNIEKLLIFTPS